MLVFANAVTWGGWLTVEPPNVLLLLLVVYVIRDEERKASVDSTLLKVLFKENLKVLVKVVERRALLKLDVVKNSKRYQHTVYSERLDQSCSAVAGSASSAEGK